MHREQSPTMVGVSMEGLEGPGTPRKPHRLEPDEFQTPRMRAKELPAVSDVSTACPSSGGFQELDFELGAAHQHSGFRSFYDAALDPDNLSGPGEDFEDFKAFFGSGPVDKTIEEWQTPVAPGADALPPSKPISYGADTCDDANFDTHSSGISNPALAEDPDQIFETESPDASIGAAAILGSLNPDLDEEELQMLAEFSMLVDTHAPLRDCPECHGCGRDRIGLTCLSCRGRGQVHLERTPCAFPETDITNNERCEPAHVMAMMAHLSVLISAIESYAPNPEAFLMPFPVVYPEADFAQNFHPDYLPEVLVQPDDQIKVLEGMLLPGQRGEDARTRVALLLRWSQPDFYAE